MNGRRTAKVLTCMLLVFFFVLSAKDVTAAAKVGIRICLETIIPALFPLMFVSVVLNSMITGKRLRWLQTLCTLCAIPPGCESLLILGLIGGYPIGAQCIAQAYVQKQIRKEDCQRLLGFCNNAGPAFIFGIGAVLFDKIYICWIVWVIQILSAIITGCILPGKSGKIPVNMVAKELTFSESVKITGRAMVNICSWVMVFRIIIELLNKWLQPLIPNCFAVIITGILELSNGCIALQDVADPSTRFMLFSLFLTFGGLCVLMQTGAVVGKLGLGFYFPGKLIQSAVCFCISYFMQGLLFRQSVNISAVFPALIIFILLGISLYSKKTVAFQKNLLYNQRKENSEVSICFSEKRYPAPAVTVNTELA